MTLRAVTSEQPTAPELDAPIVSSTDTTSTKYRIAALAYLRDDELRQAEILTLLADATAKSELAAAMFELAAATLAVAQPGHQPIRMTTGRTTAMSTQTTAVQAAADAVRAHQQAPDTATLHDMQNKIQAAHNQGATSQDIANANRTS